MTPGNALSIDVLKDLQDTSHLKSLLESEGGAIFAIGA